MLTEQEEMLMHNKIHSFITAALLAVEFAHTEGKIGSGEFSANAFLSKWLKIALKQKRFDRDLAELLTKFIKKTGAHQKLKSDFYLIYNEYRTIDLLNITFKSSDLTRLNRAFNSIKKLGMNVQVPLDYCPKESGPYQHKTNNELFILKDDYELALKDETLIDGLTLYIVGQRQPIIDCLYSNGFIAEIAGSSKLNDYDYNRFIIYPQNKIKGEVAIPTFLL